MSDQPPPPKPKPGSLRDRIAAFEKSTPSTNAAPPPLAPRPKPGQVSWKPKQATPPDSPAADETSAPQPKKSSGGMSASDAKESIGKGVSLKERMAALQGKGAFGAPSPPIAPKPAVEKPKWKPPPTIAPPPEDTDEQEKEIAIEKSEDALEQDSVPVEETPEAEEGEAAEVDPQEEERKRRAALAARMARLGGARVGMGPPVFGGPAYKKSQPKSGDSTPTSEHVKADEEPDLKSPPAPEVEAGSDEAAKKGARYDLFPRYISTILVQITLRANARRLTHPLFYPLILLLHQQLPLVFPVRCLCLPLPAEQHHLEGNLLSLPHRRRLRNQK
ncbi:hypothetical protein BT96DRAFT_234566 [Gymnopus androsaceus JB14]|uniref:Uncharacterized protein n=1 Tax=Gymnopus androsaceus JB14 TaxID=1447944 RepID=A0A6A4ILB8_9AGAR|nr:hypothetical protein BT96DRAFT_234566 [Gymnopus androsaceus JB14]